MTDKKALFVGCSFTAECGFKPENQARYHWPYIFCQQTSYNMVNRAIGGMSNQEIFFRTVEAVTNESYDLVVVMWSEVGRLWAYQSDGNIDDFVILNNGHTKGFGRNHKHTIEYAKLHCQWFNNRYVSIKHWLLQCLALEKSLKIANIPYVFIKGFSNDIDLLESISYTPESGFTNIDSAKKMFDFDNRPDLYILEKVNVLQSLIRKQDQAHWLNLKGPSFFDSQIDFADDKTHPGPVTNKRLSDSLINFYNTLYE